MAILTIDSENNVLYGNKKGGFFCAGRYWKFYGERVGGETTGRLLKHRSRTVTGAWGSEFQIADTSQRLMFSIWFDGTYVLLTWTRINSSYIVYFKRGIPNSDGTITWDPTRTVNSAGNWYMSIAICRENGPDGHIWITTNNTNSVWYFWESTDDAGTGWTRRTYTPISNQYEGANWIVPLEEAGQIYAMRSLRFGTTWRAYGVRWDGNNFVNHGQVGPDNRRVGDLIMRGNNVYALMFPHTANNNLLGRIWLYSSKSWQTERTITANADVANYATVMWEQQNGMLYAYYEKTGASEAIYRQEADGTLNDPTWGNEVAPFGGAGAFPNNTITLESFGWCQDDGDGSYPQWCRFMVMWNERDNGNFWLKECVDDEDDLCPCIPEPTPPPPEVGHIWSHRSPIQEANRRRRRYWRRGRAGRR